jgi:cyclase
MRIPRIIPVLLLRNGGLVKTVKFKESKYVGDPLNAVKIFNEKEVDELIFLDITASLTGSAPPLKFLAEVASECFMPLCYGGGIRSIEMIKEITTVGVEKVSINSYAVEKPLFIKEASDKFGSSTIVVSMDVKKNFFGKYELFTHGGKKNTGIDPIKFAMEMSKMGAGELMLNSIDRDGVMGGFDVDLIKKITKEVDIPVIACGGAGNIRDLVKAVQIGGASAVAAGSLFVFHGQHKAVLINYPTQTELKKVFLESEG